MSRARDLADLGQDKATLAGYVDTGVTSTDLERIDITTEGTSEASKAVTADSSGHVTLAGELRGPATLVIDPATVGDATGTLHVKGGLQVDGTTTTIESDTLAVGDKNIVLAKDGTQDTHADGGGITLKGESDKTITWTNSTDTWDFNQGINVTGNTTVSADLTVDTNTLKVDSTNNRVGIGESVPDRLLHLKSPSNGHTYLRMESNSGSNLNNYIEFKTQNDTKLWQLAARSDDDGNSLDFASNQSSNILCLKPNGDIGIGTNAPTCPLTIKKSVSSTVSTANNHLNIGNDQSGNNCVWNIGFGYQNSTHSPAIIGYTQTAGTNYSKGDLLFYTRNVETDTAPSERMRIDSAGNVGIGTFIWELFPFSKASPDLNDHVTITVELTDTTSKYGTVLVEVFLCANTVSSSAPIYYKGIFPASVRNGTSTSSVATAVNVLSSGIALDSAATSGTTLTIIFDSTKEVTGYVIGHGGMGYISSATLTGA